MGKVEINLSKSQIEEISELALSIYGNCEIATMTLVVEDAIKMRIVWHVLNDELSAQIEEPLMDWTFAEEKSNDEIKRRLLELLFKRG
ncbi:hypothetical protein ACFLVR_04245 [Chloroflexota bacterium]